MEAKLETFLTVNSNIEDHIVTITKQREALELEEIPHIFDLLCPLPPCVIPPSLTQRREMSALGLYMGAHIYWKVNRMVKVKYLLF